ncbi:glycosyltransferase family 9 protein [Burkholderia dolosa]|uniref:glycosyltransferase family 9 protein n=1 Tax=Burkholderia dolosa TaxID=152500 RepID=UPI001B920D1F|nr:glycosyltransferase family 9 protein [Burkholderia dolosa]MBR8060552.1 glycosyltransferase family 9 protein [Burkholderia dolosa]
MAYRLSTASAVTVPLTLDPPPRSILVSCTRRIGDVLLTTPLVRSLKRRWPDAQIDMIVFKGTEGVLEHNPDIRRVIVVAQRAKPRERFADAIRIWRRYDLACAAIGSDRARFYAWFGGRRRVGLVDPARVTRLIRFMLDGIALDLHGDVHTVTSSLAIAEALGITPCADVVAPGIGTDAARIADFDAMLYGRGGLSRERPFVVLHPSPMFRYKQWHEAGWVDLVRWARERGFDVALTGGPAPAEADYAQRIVEASREPVANFVGKLTFGETAELIRRARLFVGPDTGATHVAAASGTPTLALFGPSNPVRWGPWPANWPAHREPWSLRGSGQRGNVYLLQGEGDCVPCKLEGCDRHLDSLSRCLTTLPSQRAIAIASALVDGRPVEETPPAGPSVVDVSALRDRR